MSGMEIIWSVVGALAALLVGLGVGFLGLTPPEYSFSRFCFYISAFIMGATDFLWSIQSDWAWWKRLLTDLPIGVGVFIILPLGIRWVNRKERESANYSRGQRASASRGTQVRLYGADENLIDMSISYVTPPSPRIGVRRAYVAIVAVVLGVMSGASYIAIRKFLQPPFSIVQGSAWISSELISSNYWMTFNGDPHKSMTPINVLAFYTITNLKQIPSKIYAMSLDFSGAGPEWWGLIILPVGQPIWEVDNWTIPKHGGRVIFNDGYLTDKAAYRELRPGESVSGWLFCQLPRDYMTSKNFDKLRLTVRDTAGSEATQVEDVAPPNGIFGPMISYPGIDMDFSD